VEVSAEEPAGSAGGAGTVDRLAAGAVLHRDALVMDAASFFCRGYDDDLAASGVDVINVMVPWPADDFDQALQRVEAYYRLARDEPRLRLIGKPSDIPAGKQDGVVGLVMGAQNSQLIGDRLGRLELLQRLGFRYLQLTYNHRNLIGDGCAEPSDAGLSRFGREVVPAMNEVGIVVDVTHAGHRTALEALALTTKPALISHANPRGLYDNPRNHHDDVIRALADTGGVIGCSLPSPFNWSGEDRLPTLDDFARAIEYVIDLVGEDHVAIGSDVVVTTGAYPPELSGSLRSDLYLVSGAYYGKFGVEKRVRKVQGIEDYRDWPRITEVLLARGHGEERVRKILGENLLRVYREAWVG
jgi:membrane dipeptidase